MFVSSFHHGARAGCDTSAETTPDDKLSAFSLSTRIGGHSFCYLLKKSRKRNCYVFVVYHRLVHKQEHNMFPKQMYSFVHGCSLHRMRSSGINPVSPKGHQDGRIGAAASDVFFIDHISTNSNFLLMQRHILRATLISMYKLF